jgi:transcriptional regulator with XRE-family HTH domain
MTITPGQVVVARRLLGWTQQGLAAKTRLSQGAIANIEKGRRPLTLRTMAAIRGALESAGADSIKAGAALRSQNAVSGR